MFKTIKNFLTNIFDFILPPRTDFAIVQKLDWEKINNLPRAENVSGMSWVYPLFQYKDNRVRAIVWELKYKENTFPLEHIGKLIYEHIVALISDIVIFNNDAQFLLIPIPMTGQGRVERGYNQSELIAKSILQNDLARTLLYAPQWFEKIKETPKQSRSENKEARMKNLVDCFSADERVGGKYVILVDDVVTTGSTLSEARTTLLSAGARDVFAFTIAH